LLVGHKAGGLRFFGPSLRCRADRFPINSRSHGATGLKGIMPLWCIIQRAYWFRCRTRLDSSGSEIDERCNDDDRDREKEKDPKECAHS
jgi:hypothetical protein